MSAHIDHDTPLPRLIRLEASTACQLRCPSCPTAQGLIRQTLRTQLLPLHAFKRIVDENPGLRQIELSNWGEAFLNPHLVEMMRYAYEKDVGLSCSNGSNMNALSPALVEALVRYQFLVVTCSLDGVTQETYGRYRIAGSLARALAAIDAINEMRASWQSALPLLIWQFIVFDHNRHELDEARRMARERGMLFFAKPSWDPDLAPRAPSAPPRPGELAPGDWEHDQCRMLWNAPQINPDGRMLGCCKNYWGDFGNVTEAGLGAVFHGPAMRRARAMLTGAAAPERGVPCTSCDTYSRMRARGAFIDAAAIAPAERPRLLAARDAWKRRFGGAPEAHA